MTVICCSSGVDRVEVCSSMTVICCSPGVGLVEVEVCSSTTGVCSWEKSLAVDVSETSVVDIDLDDMEELVKDTESPLSFFRTLLGTGVDLSADVDADGKKILKEEVAEFVRKKIMVSNSNFVWILSYINEKQF